MLSQYAQALTGMEAFCFQAYADALEVIPTTLAENAGLNPIAIVTELRNRHALGERNAGINVRKVRLRSSLVCLTFDANVDVFFCNRDKSLIFWKRMLCSHCWCRQAQSSSRRRP
jgi:T-complex protein 1 subunit delta